MPSYHTLVAQVDFFLLLSIKTSTCQARNASCCENFDTGQPPEGCVVAATGFSPLLCAAGN